MFESYIGNSQAIERLSAWVESKTSTGVLLRGRKGMGLRDLALDVAKEVLNAPSLDGHPDFVFIEPDESGKIGVELIKEVIDKADYKPLKGRINVAVIDGFDATNDIAQNKLLKTLEDSENLVIIGVNYSDRVLDTIKSRMLTISFKPLTETEFKDSYKGEEADFAYILTRGCVEGINDEVVAYYKPIAEAVALDDDKDLFRILNLVKEKDTDSYISVRKNELPMLLNLLESCYLDLLRYEVLGEIGKIAQPEVIHDRESLHKKAGLVRMEKEKSSYPGYSKDDFFLFICELTAN